MSITLDGQIFDGTDPFTSSVQAVASDTVDLPFIPRAILIGKTGLHKVTMMDDAVVTFTSLTIGNVYPFRIKRLWVTGSVASPAVFLLK